MDNLIFFIGVVTGYFLFSFFPNMIFKIWDKKIDKPERNEILQLQRKGYDSLHQIKVERPNE
ncbi:MAG: hypothetical protein PF445_09410 [Melioribacteraceae bacterium]|jgi:uncharacterized membrane protein SpoIIM required for sporulation|nr:hypothetical protein [Melioribacteraceae bacterium]